jgi:DNA-binding LacI/PurR family transcriptional regulator
METFWYNHGKIIAIKTNVGKIVIMSSTITNKSNVRLLADQLEDDIRRRALFAGDRYLTASEAASQLGVSRMTANRAMNLLAHRHILVRRRRRGTFIGDAVNTEFDRAAGCVHYLSFVDEAPTLQLPVGSMVAGLRSALADVAFQSHFVPLRDALRHVRREVAKQAADPAFAGFILALGSREVQEYLAASDLPVVVYGSVYPGIDLPFVELDQKQCGRLMAEYAIELGHRRLVVLNRELWRRGDTLMLDGVGEVVHAAGLGARELTVRNISPGPGAATEIDHLLDDMTEPTSFLCRLPHIAQVVLDAAARRGIGVPEDLAVVCTVREAAMSPPCPQVCWQTDTKGQYEIIGRMLAQMGEGRVSGAEGVTLPAERRTTDQN